MTKLYMVKKGNRKFYVCKWDSGVYSIERITKGFGGSVVFKNSLEEDERYAEENGSKKTASAETVEFPPSAGTAPPAPMMN